jgi:hypothetical protein
MNKKQYKQLSARIRKIKNAKYVGSHGYYSDLAKEFNVSMCFIDNFLDMRRKSPKLIHGRYTKEYQIAQEHADYWESYHERRVGA